LEVAEARLISVIMGIAKEMDNWLSRRRIMAFA
jgi:hypothetical protein